MNKLSIVVPIYKNQDNIRPFYNDFNDNIKPFIDDYEIIMVHDASSVFVSLFLIGTTIYSPLS